MGAARWLLHPKRETRRAMRKAARNAAPHRVAFRLVTGKRTVPTRRTMVRKAKKRALAPLAPQTVATISKDKNGKVTPSKIKPLKPLNPLAPARGKTSKTQRSKAAEQRRIDAAIRSTSRRQNPNTQAAQRTRDRAASAATRAKQLPGAPPSTSPMARNATKDPATGRMTGSHPDRLPTRNLPWTAATCEWCHGRGLRPLYTGNRVRSILGMTACTHVPVPLTPPGLEIQMPPAPGDRYVCAKCNNEGVETVRVITNEYEDGALVRTIPSQVLTECRVCLGHITHLAPARRVVRKKRAGKAR